MMRILIAGYYGFSNTGDEAILAGMLRDLRAEIPEMEVTVISGNPVQTRELHGVRSILFTELDSLTREAAAADLLVVGGGGIFHDTWGFDPDTLLTPRHGALSFFCALPVLAARFGKPLMIYGVGVGPLKTEEARKFTRAAFQQAAVSTVRDEFSREELERAGVNPEAVIVTADPAFSYRPSSVGGSGLPFVGKSSRPQPTTHNPQPGKRPRLGVIARNWDIGVVPETWEAELAQALDLFLEHHDGEIVMIPFQRLPWDLLDDVAVAKRIRERMRRAGEVTLLEQPPSLATAWELLGSCDLIFPMRLHALLFAVQQMVPVSPVLYDQKVRSLVERMVLTPYSLELSELRSDTIIRKLEAALSARTRIRSILKRSLPQLRELSRQNARLAAEALAADTVVTPGPEMKELLRKTESKQPEQRAAEGEIAFDVLAFPIINWEFRFQRPQQLLSRLARAGHRVFYLRTEFRGLDQRPAVRPIADGVFEIELPGRIATDVYGGHLDSETLFQSVSALDEIAREHRMTRAINFVQYPFWEPLADAMNRRFGFKTVYDRLDEHTGFGTHGPQTVEDERRLLERADLVLVSSSRLARYEGSEERPPVLLPNAGEFAHFNSLPDRELSPIATLPRPVVGYYGAIAHWFDIDSFREAARTLSDWSFVLIGHHDPEHLRPLEILPNVHILGEKNYQELPAYLAGIDVCTIPFRRMPLTDAASPVKIFEYFAAGKPVVATDLPEIQAVKDLAYPYSTAAEFVQQLQKAATEQSPELRKRRQEYARRNTWDDRVAVLLPLLRDLAVRTPQRIEAAGRAIAASAAEGREQRRKLRTILKKVDGTPIVFLSSPVESRRYPGRTEAVARALGEQGRTVIVWEEESTNRPAGIVELQPKVYRATVPPATLTEIDSPVVVATLDRRHLLAELRNPRLVYDCVAAPAQCPGELEELMTAHQELLEAATLVTFASPDLRAELPEIQNALLIQDGGAAAELLLWIDRSRREEDDAERLRSRMVRLEGTLAQLRSRLADRAAELRLFNDLSTEQQKGIDFLQKEVAQRDAMIASLREVVTESQKGVEFLQGSIATLERIVADKEKAIDFLKQESVRFNSALAERDNDLNFLRDELHKVEDEIHHLQAEHDIKRREVQHLNATTQEQTRGIEWLRTEVAAREEKLQKIYHSRMWRTADVYWRVRHAAATVAKPLRKSPRDLMLKVGRRLLPRPAKRFLKRFWDPNQRVSVKEAALLQRSLPVAVPALPGAAALPRPVKYDILCFSIIDWDFRWQRPQQIMARFARNGHRVFFIKTTDFLSDPSGRYEARSVRENVWELKLATSRPIDVYGGDLAPDEVESVLANLDGLQREFNINCAVSVVQVPTWAPAAYAARDRFGWKILYDCMDDWNTFPGMKPALIHQEERLVSRADVVTVSAQRLVEKWSGWNRNLLLARNAADYEHYAGAQPNDLLSDLPHPIVGYFGAIADWFDLPLMTRLAQERPRYSFVLIGGIFDRDLDELRRLPNVRVLGQKPYELMPSYLVNFDVCIIPFVVNAVTEATDPVKFYEYISLGKPVVAPRMPELFPYRDLLYIAENEADFIAKVDRAVQENDVGLVQRRVDLARENTWAARVAAMEEAIAAAHPKVSVVIVTYFNLDYTKLCIDSVFRNTLYPNFELIVVDNASTDGTPEYLRALQEERPGVKVILNSRNLGFAKANNQGLAQAAGEYYVLLNNDTVVPNGWLPKFMRHLDDPTVGLVVPVTNFSGNESRIDVPYTDLEQMEVFAADYTRGHQGKKFDIRVAAMYCVGIRRDVFHQVGPLDEQFSVGMFEDDDYSHRIRLVGYRVICVEDTFIHHFGQASFKKLSQVEYQAIWDRNQELYEKKWGVQWKPHTLRPGVQ